LFVKGYRSKDNLLVASRELGRVSIEYYLEVLKLVVELDYIVVII